MHVIPSMATSLSLYQKSVHLHSVNVYDLEVVLLSSDILALWYYHKMTEYVAEVVNNQMVLAVLVNLTASLLQDEVYHSEQLL